MVIIALTFELLVNRFFPLNITVPVETAAAALYRSTSVISSGSMGAEVQLKTSTTDHKNGKAFASVRINHKGKNPVYR